MGPDDATERQVQRMVEEFDEALTAAFPEPAAYRAALVLAVAFLQEELAELPDMV